MATPRLVAPLSTATVTSQTPTLRWQLAAGSPGVHVEVCADRACTQVTQQFDATGSSATLATALTPGVHFWHARSLDGATYGPTWEFWVGHRSAPVDTSWGSTLDVNGDGYADVAVGAHTSEVAYVYLGGPTGLSTQPTMTLEGPAGSQLYAWNLTSAGDTNGDGYADLMVEDFGSGTVYVYLGGATGLDPNPRTLVAPAGSPQFGSAIAGVGDVDGDGYGDVVISATGAVYLYLGSEAGPSPSPITLTDSNQSDTVFGSSLTSVGDINGDGYGDIAVGGVRASVVDIYSGGPNGPSGAPRVIQAQGSFGYRKQSAGDVNGDGYADLLLESSDYWTMSLFFGSATGIDETATAWTVTNGTLSNMTTGAIAGVGDVNGDGYADVFGTDTYLYLGGAAGPDASHPIPVGLGNPATIAGAGDINGDGYDDFIAGGGGNAVVIFGGPSLPSVSMTTLVDPHADGSYGSAVARADDEPATTGSLWERTTVRHGITPHRTKPAPSGSRG